MWFKQRRKMKPYAWVGLDSHGKRCQGILDAHHKQDAQQRLQAQQLTILQLKKQMRRFSLTQPTIRHKHIADFTQQLNTLLQAGMTLSPALHLLSQQCQHTPLKNLIQRIHTHIDQGSSLSTALKQYPQYFDTTYCSLVAAGEASSRLTTLFDQLSDYLQRRKAIKAKIQKAMLYPSTILFVAIGIGVGLLTFVIPQFQNIFASFGAKLPLFTRIIINMAHALQRYGPGLLISFAVSVVTLRLLYQYNASVAYGIDTLTIHIPLLNHLILVAHWARWSRVLATMTEAGIPLLSALALAKQSISNRHLQRRLSQLSSRLMSGQSLQNSLKPLKWLPADIWQTLATGENTGKLAHVFSHVADRYQTKLNNIVDNLSKLLEPITIIFVSGLTGCLIIAMYLPIFKLGMVF